MSLGRLRSNRLVRGVGMQAGGAALAQVVVIASTPLLTRLYDEEDFGSFEVYAQLVLVVAVLSTGRLFEAIVVPSRDEDGRSVFGAGLTVLGGYVAAVLVAVALLRNRIADWMDAPDLASLLWLAPLGVAALGMRQLYQGWAVRAQNYTALAENNLSRGIAASAVNVGAGVAGLGSVGLVLGHSAGFGIASWRLGRRLKVPSATGSASTREVISEYRRFPLLSGPSALLNAASRGLPAFALTIMFGPATVGFYGLVTRALGQPLLLFQEASNRVFSGEAGQLRRDGQAGMRRLAISFLKSQSVIGTIIVAAAFMLAPPLFPVVFGQRWAEAATFLQIMAPLFLIRTIVGPMMATFSILNRQSTHLVVEVVRMVAVLLSFVVSNALSLDRFETLGVFTAVATAGQLFAVAAVLFEARRWDLHPLPGDAPASA